MCLTWFNFELSSSFPAEVEEPNDYSIEYLINIRAGTVRDEGDTGPFFIGRVWLDRILWSIAEASGENLAEVCDAVGFPFVFSLLTDQDAFDAAFGHQSPKDLLRDDIGLESPFSDEVIVIHRFMLHPDFSQQRPFLLRRILEVMSTDEAITLIGLGEESREWGVSRTELHSCGFVRVAEWNYGVRDHRLVAPIDSEEFPDCSEIVTEQHEESLEIEWNCENRPPTRT